jgi:hypothetical protein
MTPGERVDAAMMLVGQRPEPLAGDELMERATLEWVALDEALGLLGARENAEVQKAKARRG